MATSLNPLFEERHSGRRFNPDAPVPHDALRLILEAGQRAPSCYNEQPWRYIVCDRVREKKSYGLVLEQLVPANRAWAKDAPVLIVACSLFMFTKTKEGNRWGAYDTGAASMAMSLQAASMGLMIHQMGGFDGPELTRLFGIPLQGLPMAVMALGYEVVDDTPRTPRVRHPLGHNFYAGAWEKPFE